MKVIPLSDFTGGWYIGNFDPSLLKTYAFEASVKVHKKGENWPVHYHKIATEYNVIIAGRMTIQNRELNAGDIFIIEPFEVADPIFHEDTIISCIKVPGAKQDKYEL